MGGDSRQVGGDFLAKPLDPEGPPPAQTTLPTHVRNIITREYKLPKILILGSNLKKQSHI